MIEENNFFAITWLTLYGSGIDPATKRVVSPHLTKHSSPKCNEQICDEDDISDLSSIISSQCFISASREGSRWNEYFCPSFFFPGHPLTMQTRPILIFLSQLLQSYKPAICKHRKQTSNGDTEIQKVALTDNRQFLQFCQKYENFIDLNWNKNVNLQLLKT